MINLVCHYVMWMYFSFSWLLIHIQTGFSREEIFRKYIRYALNEKPFNPEMVATLIQFRKASLLDDSQVAEILNEISRRIVRDKGNSSYYCLCYLYSPGARSFLLLMWE